MGNRVGAEQQDDEGDKEEELASNYQTQRKNLCVDHKQLFVTEVTFLHSTICSIFMQRYQNKPVHQQIKFRQPKYEFQ